MSTLEEKLEAKRAAKEDEQYASLRAQVRELTQKRDELKGLAEALHAAYGEAGEAVKKRKGEVRKIGEIFKRYKGVLKEEGIMSSAELLESAEHRETPEVVSAQAAREELRGKVKSTRGIKQKIIEKLLSGKETPWEGKGKAKDIVEAVLGRIQNLDQEIQKLHEQTPEGKAEKKERAKKELSEEREKRGRVYTPSLEDAKLINWVGQEELLVGDKYGAELAREVVTESAQASVDAAVKRRKEQEGLDAATTDIETLEALPRKYNEAKGLLQDIERKRALVLAELDILKSEKSVLETTRSEKEASSRAREDLLSRMEERIVSPSLEYNRDALQNILRIEAWILDPRWEDKLAYKLSHLEKGHSAKQAGENLALPNFDRIIAEARRFQEFYARLHTYLGEHRTLPADFGDIEPSDSRDEIRKISPQIAVRAGTLRILAEHHFLLTAAKEGVQRRIKGIETEGEKIKTWLPAEIRRRWAKAMEEDLTRRNPEIPNIEQKRSKIEQGKQLAAKLLPELGIVKAGLAEEDLAETVALERYSGTWNPPDIRVPRIYEKLQVAEKELREAEEKVRNLNAGIARIDREISMLFRVQIFKKAELEAEREKKEDDRDVETKVAEEKKRERDVLFKKQTRIFEIRRILQIEEANAITNEIMGSRDGTRVVMLAMDLLSKIGRICEQRQNAKLSDEEQALYDRQRVLRAESERAREEADRIWEAGKK